MNALSCEWESLPLGLLFSVGFHTYFSQFQPICVRVIQLVAVEMR